MTVRLIDISAAQGAISPKDWETIAASGVRGVYIEAGIGNDHPNPRFAEYVAGARAAGLVVGAYSFAYPLPPSPAHPGRDPEDQAQAHYLACQGLGSSAGELPHALDVEWPELGAGWHQWGVDGPSIDAWCQAYLAKADALWGRESLLYTYPSFAETVRFGPVVGSRRLWIASYKPTPTIPAPWSACIIQQVSGGGGRLPSGLPVDEDLVVDEATFGSLLNP